MAATDLCPLGTHFLACLVATGLFLLYSHSLNIPRIYEEPPHLTACLLATALYVLTQ
jgi:hypothetical protein